MVRVSSENAENDSFCALVKLPVLSLKVPMSQFEECWSTASMLSYIELGPAVSTLFFMDRRDFEFISEKLKKYRQVGFVTHPTPNPVGHQDFFLGGIKDGGREADRLRRSTAKLKMPVSVPTYVVTERCLIKHSEILPEN